MRSLTRKSCAIKCSVISVHIPELPLNHLTQVWIGSTAMLAWCPACVIYLTPIYPNQLQSTQLYYSWDQASSETAWCHVDIHRAGATVWFEWINYAIFQLSDLMDAVLQLCSHGNVETAMEIRAVSSYAHSTRSRTKTFSPFEWTKAGVFSSANM